MRTLLILAMSCMLTASCEANEAPQQALNSSVEIQVQLGSNWTTMGSGVEVVDSNLGVSIVTAKHVAVFSTVVPMRACTENESDCTTLGSYYSSSSVAEPSDWAVFQLDQKIKHTHPTRLAKPDRIGETVWEIGNPHGVPVCAKGELSYPIGGMFVVHGFAYPGSSGGGVFNNRGELLGIMVAIPVWEDLKDNPSLMTDLALVVPASSIGILR